MSDSWMTDGNCELCRRNDYCKKECKKHKERKTRRLYCSIPVALGAYYRTLAERKSEN